MRKYDIVGLTETLSFVFDANEFNEHETFAGKHKSILKSFRGLALLVRKYMKSQFTETSLGLWLNISLNRVDYSIGLYYIPCESSRHWDGYFFDELQEDILKYKNASRNFLLMGDFNARSGRLDDSIQSDGEINHIEPRANKDEKIKTNGRLLVDLCKTTEIAIVKGRIGQDKSHGEYTCITHNGKSNIDYFLAEYFCFNSFVNFTVNSFHRLLTDVHCSLVLELENTRTDAMIVKPVSSPFQIQLFWNEEIRVKYRKHLGAGNFAELQRCFEDELQTLSTVNKINGVLIGILHDSAKSVGALKCRRNLAFQRRNNWFDSDCHNQRTIYRKKLR